MTPVTNLPRDRQTRSIVHFVSLTAALVLAALPSEAFSEEARRPVEAPAPIIRAQHAEVEQPVETVAARIAPESPIRNIAEAISHRLAVGHLGNYAIDVSFVDGVVTLAGHVTDEETKRRAAHIAEQVDGVRSLVNRLTTNRRDAGENHGRQVRGEATTRGMKESDRHRPTINVIVTVNVNSGNVFGPAGPPKHERDQLRSERSDGDEEFERAMRERDETIDRLRHELETLRNRGDSPEARERAEQRSREFRERFEQDARRRFEEVRRERDERARQRDAEAEKEATEAAEDAAADAAEKRKAADAAEDPAASETSDEPRASQAPVPGGDLVEFVTNLFE